MTVAERELLLLLAHEIAQDVARNLREAGLKESEGVGGATIRKIISLTESIRAQASAD